MGEQDSGISLKKLVDQQVEARLGRPGPPVSPRVRWLSEYIETPDFWTSLQTHASQDERQRIHTASGLFDGKYGQRAIGRYRWQSVYTSLDNFLEHAGLSAAEFIFRDFHPQNEDPDLLQAMQSTRQVVLGKYPRVRRLYWPDYQFAFQQPEFWQALANDLQRPPVPKPLQTFIEQPVQQTALAEMSRQNFEQQRRGRARFFDYQSMSQIIEEETGKNLRDYLREIVPDNESSELASAMIRAQRLLVSNITKETNKPIKKITMKNLEKMLQSPAFWDELMADVQAHQLTDTPVNSLGLFLRGFRADSKEVYGTAGKHSKVIHPFIKGKSGITRKMRDADDDAVTHLMWKLDPQPETESQVKAFRELCSRVFPRDCLYVILQTDSFWTSFFGDLEKVSPKISLWQYLKSYHQSKTPEEKGEDYFADRREKIFRSAYLHKKDFIKFVADIGVGQFTDFKEALAALLLQTCPEQNRQRLQQEFPAIYDQQEKAKRTQSRKMRLGARGALRAANLQESKQVYMGFPSKEEAENFRHHLEKAAKSLKIHYRTHYKDGKLFIKIVLEAKATRREIELRDIRVKQLRERGLSYKAIARSLDYPISWVEASVSRLIRYGRLSQTKKSVAIRRSSRSGG